MENARNYYDNQQYNNALSQTNGNYTLPSTDETQYHQRPSTSEQDISHYRVASRYEKECEVLKDLKSIKAITEKLIFQHHFANNQITLKKVQFSTPYLKPKSPTTDTRIPATNQESTSNNIPRKYTKLTNLEKLTLDNIYAKEKFQVRKIIQTLQ